MYENEIEQLKLKLKELYTHVGDTINYDQVSLKNEIDYVSRKIDYLEAYNLTELIKKEYAKSKEDLDKKSKIFEEAKTNLSEITKKEYNETIDNYKKSININNNLARDYRVFSLLGLVGIALYAEMKHKKRK